LKWQRIISLVTLCISILTLILVLRKPAPVAQPQASPADTAANAQSFQSKISQLDRARGGETSAEIRINNAELGAALAEAAGMIPAAAVPTGGTPAGARPGTGNANGLPEFSGPVPAIKDYQVAMEGDILRGQFLTQIAGKDVYLTLAGHLGAKDGYATFDATEVKIGDLAVPASLVNEALQKKLMEQRDQLKLPDTVKGLRIENGELVLDPK
jgi:hypothetical protein